jgi:hypothetical protein
MSQNGSETLVTAFFASILITLAAGLGSALYLAYDAQAGLAVHVAGCVAAGLVLAGWARQPLGLTRFGAAVLGLIPLPALAVPAIAIGAGGGWVAGFGLGLATAVLAYGALATGYAYSWTRMVGRWADSRSRRG